MCGRFTIGFNKKELEQFVKDEYNIDKIDINIQIPNYNVAPGSNIISIINDGQKYVIGQLKWGFTPPFQLDNNINIINARAETLFEKPMFKSVIMHNRCIVLADSFYEWRNLDGQPMRIMTLDKIFAMAGIWATFTDHKGNKINTVAIITTESNQAMREIHERMPVILSKEDERIWLSPYSTKEEIIELLVPYDDSMKIYPVSKKVNSTRVNDISLIAEVKLQKTLFDYFE